jgi:hypothetical protein
MCTYKSAGPFLPGALPAEKCSGKEGTGENGKMLGVYVSYNRELTGSGG